jgi:hypothetical protein
MNVVDVRADDARLDALAAGAQPGDELERLLTAWRARVDAEPFRGRLSVHSGCVVIAAGRVRARRKKVMGALRGILVAWVAAILIAVVVLAKMGVFSW